MEIEVIYKRFGTVKKKKVRLVLPGGWILCFHRKCPGFRFYFCKSKIINKKLHITWCFCG